MLRAHRMNQKIRKRKRASPAPSGAAQKILGYLAQHPKASDSLEGILHWWMIDQVILQDEQVVRLALNDLVEAGYVVSDRGVDHRAHFSVNMDRLEEIRELIGWQRGALRSRIDERA